jgi:hypothetical protein
LVTSNELRVRATQYRRLRDMQLDAVVLDTLKQLADEYEQEADRMDRPAQDGKWGERS